MIGHRARTALVAALAGWALAGCRAPDAGKGADSGRVAAGGTPAPASAAARSDSGSASQGAPGAVPCGAVRLNVVIRQAVLSAPATDPVAAERELRGVATRVLGPIRERVSDAPIDVSPAVRTFRFALRDAAAVAGAVETLRRSPEVEAIERDECVLRPGGR